MPKILSIKIPKIPLKLPELSREEELFLLVAKQAIQFTNQSKQIEEQAIQLTDQSKQIEEQEKQIKSLTIENKELKRRLNMNSDNSSKPSSTDGYKKGDKNKNRSLKGKSDKKRWGQKWHKWATLLPFKKPDTIEVLEVATCSGCGWSLTDTPMVNIQKRQVLDIPEPTYFVHEYQWWEKQCPCCQTITKSQFPYGVVGDIQIGPNIKTHSCYIYNHGIVSYQRIAEYFQEIYQFSISQTSLMKFNKEGYVALDPVSQCISNAIKKDSIQHNDETGTRIAGSTKWIHVASTKLLTAYKAHRKRWWEAIADMWTLVGFLWKVVHDHWMPYFSYEECMHILCNAHHLRELIAVIQNENTTTTWAQPMIDCILWAKKLKDEAISRGEDHLEEKILQEIHTEYQRVIVIGVWEYPEVLRQPGTRGKIKKPKGQNLLERLRKHEAGTLEFVHDFNVPFDNNLAERDLRMIKVRTKVSGCFRSFEWAEWFCRIRGYISTMRKQWLPIYPAMKSMFEGQVIFPNL